MALNFSASTQQVQTNGNSTTDQAPTSETPESLTPIIKRWKQADRQNSYNSATRCVFILFSILFSDQKILKGNIVGFFQ